MLGGLCPLCLLSGGTKYEYTIVNVIGCSENGIIYLAEQWPTHRLVTVKVLNDASNSKAALERLERQRDALLELAHPLAAGYIDIGLTNDHRAYVIRDYLRGASLNVYCKQYQVDPSARQRFLTAVCEVIAQAHGQGIAHGNLKPTNILISHHDRDPVVKVVDFGVRDAAPADDSRALTRLAIDLS